MILKRRLHSQVQGREEDCNETRGSGRGRKRRRVRYKEGKREKEKENPIERRGKVGGRN